MSGWREPRPGEHLIVMDRWEIESADWMMYRALCDYPNTFSYAAEQVSWLIPDQTYVWFCLRWPELAQYERNGNEDHKTP